MKIRLPLTKRLYAAAMMILCANSDYSIDQSLDDQSNTGRLFSDCPTNLSDRNGWNCIHLKKNVKYNLINLTILKTKTIVWGGGEVSLKDGLFVKADDVTITGINFENSHSRIISVEKGMKNILIKDNNFLNNKKSSAKGYISSDIHLNGDTSSKIINNTFINDESFQIIRIDGYSNRSDIGNNFIRDTAFRFVGVGIGSKDNKLIIHGNTIINIGSLSPNDGVGATAIYADSSDYQPKSKIYKNIIYETVENGIEGPWGLIDSNNLIFSGELTGKSDHKYYTPSRFAISVQGPSKIINNVTCGRNRSINIVAPYGLKGNILLDNNKIKILGEPNTFPEKRGLFEKISIPGNYKVFIRRLNISYVGWCGVSY